MFTRPLAKFASALYCCQLVVVTTLGSGCPATTSGQKRTPGELRLQDYSGCPATTSGRKRTPGELRLQDYEARLTEELRDECHDSELLRTTALVDLEAHATRFYLSTELKFEDDYDWSFKDVAWSPTLEDPTKHSEPQIRLVGIAACYFILRNVERNTWRDGGRAVLELGVRFNRFAQTWNNFALNRSDEYRRYDFQPCTEVSDSAEINQLVTNIIGQTIQDDPCGTKLLAEMAERRRRHWMMSPRSVKSFAAYTYAAANAAKTAKCSTALAWTFWDVYVQAATSMMIPHDYFPRTCQEAAESATIQEIGWRVEWLDKGCELIPTGQWFVDTMGPLFDVSTRSVLEQWRLLYSVPIRSHEGGPVDWLGVGTRLTRLELLLNYSETEPVHEWLRKEIVRYVTLLTQPSPNDDGAVLEQRQQVAEEVLRKHPHGEASARLQTFLKETKPVMDADPH